MVPVQQTTTYLGLVDAGRGLAPAMPPDPPVTDSRECAGAFVEFLTGMRGPAGEGTGDAALGDAVAAGLDASSRCCKAVAAGAITRAIAFMSGITTSSTMPCCRRMALYCSTVDCRPAMTFPCRAITYTYTQAWTRCMCNSSKMVPVCRVGSS